MEDQISSNKKELWNLSIKDLFYKYVRFLPWFILSVVVALSGAWLYLRYAPQTYEAGGTLIIKSEKQAIRNDKMEDILSGNSRMQSIQSEIEMLRSRPLVTRVVDRLHLQQNYVAIGKFKDLNVYKDCPFLVDVLKVADSSRPYSFKLKFIDGSRYRMNDNPAILTFGQLVTNEFGVFRIVKNNTPYAGTEYKFSWEPAYRVVSTLVRNLKVQPRTLGTGILSISIPAENGTMAADVVNTLMAEYDVMTVEQNNFSTDQILSFVDSRLNILNRELDSIQYILLDYQQRNNIIDAEVQSGEYFKKISEADKAVNEQKIRVDVANIIDGYLSDKRNQYSRVVVPSSLGLEDITLNELVMAYNKAQLERQVLLGGNVPPDNPYVKEAEGQIENLRERVRENIRNIKSSYNSVIATLQRRGIQEQSQLRELPYKLKEYVEIQRQVNSKLALFNLLQGKREETAITRASTISNSKVIDMAVPSSFPVKPNRRAVQLLALLIGLALPAVVLFIRELLNDKVNSRADIERITNAPILGEVGHSFTGQTLVVTKTSRSMVAEQFRIIRSNLQYVLPQKEKPVILITSSFSGEGKSFVSTNMAAVMALTGKKTVILEFDIRKPRVLAGLGMSKQAGISNYLIGKAELKDLIIPVEGQENLFVLPCGPIPPNPSELLLDPRVTELFARLREEFDMIFIDTAPVGMVSDAMTLGKYADCTLYLVRQGHTFKKQIGLIDELYREEKLPKVSVIINDVKMKHGYGYYGYGRYGYGYGYGEKSGYYDEERPQRGFFGKLFYALNPLNWFRRKR
ncbi:MAG: polysaccharide biosynthesis tyrosine autokinase [Chitinophagaceae bacterium]